MTNVVDLLHINDIVVLHIPKDEESLSDWKDTKFMAQVFLDGELLDEGGEYMLPVIRRGPKTVVRWDLGAFQVPAECDSFTLAITTPIQYRMFEFLIFRPLDQWMIKSRRHFRDDFRTFVDLFIPGRSNYGRAVTGLFGVQMARWDDSPSDSPIGRDIVMLRRCITPESLISLGRCLYKCYEKGGDKTYLMLVLAAFKRALRNPSIDSDSVQVLKSIMPFVHCLLLGPISCLGVAFQVLQTFPGLPNARLDLQLFLHHIVLAAVCSPDWHDYFALAVKLISSYLHVLLSCTPSEPGILAELLDWIMAASHHIPDAKEVLPLLDLGVRFLPPLGLDTSGNRVSFAILRGAVSLRQANLRPKGPSLDEILTVVELVMHSLAGIDIEDALISDSGLNGAYELSIDSCHGLGRHAHESPEIWVHKDRVLCFIVWYLSKPRLFPEPMPRVQLKYIQNQLAHPGRDLENCTVKESLILLPRHVALGDNDEDFIHRALQWNAEPIKNIPAEYPEGAAELVRIILELSDNSVPYYPLIAALIAHALRLPEAFRAYEVFMDTLDQPLAFSALTRDRLKLGVRYFSVVRDAISYVLDMGNQPGLALQWSEQNRCRIWHWVFQCRSSLDRVQAMEPYLAKRLKAGPMRWIDKWVRCTRIGTEFPLSDLEECFMTLGRLTRLPGLERLLRPKTPVEIMSVVEALGGPVIYLDPSRYSSHALAVVPGLDDIVHIPLPRFHYQNSLYVSLKFAKSPQSFLQEDSPTARKGFKVTPEQFKQPPQESPPILDARSLLRDLWFAVVEPVLAGLGIQHPQTRTIDKPRIWWSPSGSLSYLPLHAAGVYQDDGQGPIISDYVVSSYFPSATALAYATRPEDGSEKFSLLTIANPTGAGLPGTEWELEMIKKHTPTKELTGGEATVEAVKKGMEDASWVHFACHGVAKPFPMDSALILANDTRLTLGELSEMSLPHAQFAFLSACQTAKGHDEVPEHCAHLSVGMLACGYRSVIGTMWKISDEHAPFVADRVYEKMFEGGRPDYKRAAYALHDAVQALRKERGVSFATWLPFIHVGV